MQMAGFAINRSCENKEASISAESAACWQRQIMAYILRFTQQYRPDSREEFLALEAKFVELERRSPAMPQGRRMQPVAGAGANHTLIWECEFATFAEVDRALAQLAGDAEHSELFRRQSPYIVGIHTAIFEVLF